MIAYASLAGLPPQAGLYTLLASLGLYAVFGTGRQLVMAGTSASAGLGLAGHGVKVIGTIPTGLPAASWPHLRLDDLWVLLPSAAAMMLVIFSEALGAGQAFAGSRRTDRPARRSPVLRQRRTGPRRHRAGRRGRPRRDTGRLAGRMRLPGGHDVTALPPRPAAGLRPPGECLPPGTSAGAGLPRARRRSGAPR